MPQLAEQAKGTVVTEENERADGVSYGASGGYVGCLGEGAGQVFTWFPALKRVILSCGRNLGKLISTSLCEFPLSLRPRT
jgi:hypothetical protein